MGKSKAKKPKQSKHEKHQDDGQVVLVKVSAYSSGSSKAIATRRRSKDDSGVGLSSSPTGTNSIAGGSAVGGGGNSARSSRSLRASDPSLSQSGGDATSMRDALALSPGAAARKERMNEGFDLTANDPGAGGKSARGGGNGGGTGGKGGKGTWGKRNKQQLKKYFAELGKGSGTKCKDGDGGNGSGGSGGGGSGGGGGGSGGGGGGGTADVGAGGDGVTRVVSEAVRASVHALTPERFIAETGPMGELENEQWKRNEPVSTATVKVFEKRLARPYVCVRETMYLKAPASEIVQLLNDYRRRPEWDLSLVEVALLADFPGGHVLRHVHTSSTLHRHRDFVFASKQVFVPFDHGDGRGVESGGGGGGDTAQTGGDEDARLDCEGGTTFFLASSVKGFKSPGFNCVRGTMAISGIMVRPCGTATAPRSLVVFLSQVDMKISSFSFRGLHKDELAWISQQRLLNLEKKLKQQRRAREMQRKIQSTSPRFDRRASERMNKSRRTEAQRLTKRVKYLQSLMDDVQGSGATPSPTLSSTGSLYSGLSSPASSQSLAVGMDGDRDDALTFEQIMGDSVCCLYFQRYLDTELNGENMR